MLRNVFLHRSFYYAVGAILALFVAGYLLPNVFPIAIVAFYTFCGVLVVDLILLYRSAKPVVLQRFTPDKLSNGDPNEIRLYIENKSLSSFSAEIIDEVPPQFQDRSTVFRCSLPPGANQTISYSLRPVKRGVYGFGKSHMYLRTPISLVVRRISLDNSQEIPVYPSFLDLGRYEIMAIHHRLSEFGIKKVRRIGHTMEFEQIKEYVRGDDYRTVNWQATARAGTLMVNTYQDERSQQVYSIVDKGRAMKLPFNGMTLLDYAINASLMISNIALKKHDRAGLITFHQKVTSVLPASKRNNQLSYIMEALYGQKTAYKESDYSRLYAAIRARVSQRSLLLLFTNLETLSGMERQLSYMKSLAKLHVLVVIFFKNVEVEALIDDPATSVKGVYHKTMAEQYVFEKRVVQKVLNSHGIHTVLTTPEDLSVQTINKYLELKARGLV